MPISLDTLRAASTRGTLSKSASTLTEARSLGVRTAFLCHSHNDETLVRGLLNLFQEDGWRVYVDWQDPTMGEKPTKETAERIKLTIRVMDYFLFLATPNSVTSRWCPWEIGYADREKGIERVLIIPTTDRTGDWYGNEYLQLYRKIDEAKDGKLGVWNPNETGGVYLSTL
jgi:TIR domain